jgi:hypothetical protein
LTVIPNSPQLSRADKKGETRASTGRGEETQRAVSFAAWGMSPGVKSWRILSVRAGDMRLWIAVGWGCDGSQLQGQDQRQQSAAETAAGSAAAARAGGRVMVAPA